MKFYLGVTDNKWYNYLSRINPEDINFWQPGGNSTFRVLESGAPFLFKLKYPTNVIGGIGFFSSHTFLPINMAWDVFGNRNGCDTFTEFQNLILQYRVEKININPTIGCSYQSYIF
jgi:putative restriction endonuclease